MSTSGSGPSQDPKFSNDPNKNPHLNEPNEFNKPHSSSDDFQKEKETNTHSSKEKYKKAYDEIEDKVKGTIKNLKDSDAYHYASTNKEHTITYILLALGLVLLFFDTLFGGLLVGMVTGYHFAPQIVYYLRNLTQIFEGQDQLRYIVLTGALLGLFIEAPGIFIGAIIVAIFKQLIFNKSDSNSANPRTNQEITNRGPGPKNNFGSTYSDKNKNKNGNNGSKGRR